MGFSVLYVVSCVILIAVFFFFPQKGERVNAIGWLVVCLVFYECWASLITGVFSLIHIPVGLLSVSIANIVAAVVIQGLFNKFQSPKEPVPFYASYWSKRQRFFVDWVDIAFAVLLACFFIYVFVERFGQEAAIIYGTIDPADRFSRAVGILAEKTVIGNFPNMYLGHVTNALFLGVSEPWFSGAYAVRAFEVKELINVWLGGMLFFYALRQISEKFFAKIVCFAMGFIYALGYPWNNELWGFGYIGVSVTLIILVQIGIKYLFDDNSKSWIGLILISAGCFGTGLTYTMFAPPVFIAAFIAIILWKRKQPISLIKTEIVVFAIPVIMTLIYTVLMGPAEDSVGLDSELMVEGAIHRNLFGDFLIWLPFAIFAVVFLIAKRKPDFSWVFAVVFLAFQAFFLFLMMQGTISTYYYYKLNFVTWFIVLFLAGYAIIILGAKSRLNIAMMGCCMLVFLGTVYYSVNGYDYILSNRNPLMNSGSVANGLVGVYLNNNAYFNDLSINPVYYRHDFIELCSAARDLRISTTDANLKNDYYKNRIEVVTDHFHDAYWADALVGEHIENQSAKGIKELPDSSADIWIIMKNSELYNEHADSIDTHQRLFENNLGFVIVLPNK